MPFLMIEQNKIDFAAAGGIKMLLDAIATHNNSCPVAQWALSSLCAITYLRKHFFLNDTQTLKQFITNK